MILIKCVNSSSLDFVKTNLVDEEPLPFSGERHLGRVLTDQRIEERVVLFGLNKKEESELNLFY